MAGLNKPKVTKTQLGVTMSPAAAKTKATRVTFVMDPDLHKRFKHYSTETGISMSALLSEWVQEKLDSAEPRLPQ